MARHVADNILGFHARLPICGSENYIRKCRKRQKGVLQSVIMRRTSICPRNAPDHPCGIRVQPATFLSLEDSPAAEIPADEFIDGRVVQAAQVHYFRRRKTPCACPGSGTKWRLQGGRRRKKHCIGLPHTSTALDKSVHFAVYFVNISLFK